MPHRVDEFVELCRTWNDLSPREKYWIYISTKLKKYKLLSRWDEWIVPTALIGTLVVGDTLVSTISILLVFCYYIILRPYFSH